MAIREAEMRTDAYINAGAPVILTIILSQKLCFASFDYTGTEMRTDAYINAEASGILTIILSEE